MTDLLRPRSKAPWHPRWTWILAGLVLGAALALIVFLRQTADPVTAETLAAAQQLWDARRPASYDLEVETGGAMSAVHHIEVRDGEPIRMTTGGVDAAPSAWEYWTVDGMLGVIATELANAEHPERVYGVEPGSVVIQGRFDPEWGYPIFFLRHVMGKQTGVEWRVTSFQVLAP